MKINKRKMDLAMAKACMSVTDLRKEFSSATLTNMRNNPEHNVTPKTVGRLARTLNCNVDDLIEQEAG